VAGVAALAAAAAALGAQGPVCGTGRAAELGAHGPTIASLARQGEPLRALRELAVALGYASHGSTTVPDADLHPAGGAMAVPPTVVPPTPPLSVAPPNVPSEIHRAGGPMRLRPYRDPLPLHQVRRALEPSATHPSQRTR
jgi:hypothetical protein